MAHTTTYHTDAAATASLYAHNVLGNMGYQDILCVHYR
jgi:hypothetical protein